MNLKELLNLGETLTADLIIKKVTTFALSKLGALSGPLGWLVSFVIKLAINYVIWPAMEDIIGEGKLIFEKAKIDKHVKELEDASSLTDISSAFSNLE